MPHSTAIRGYNASDAAFEPVYTDGSNALMVATSGTATIGKLGANSGVDIGDVDVTSLPAASLAVTAANIAINESLSAEIDLGDGRVLCAIDMPADWTAANLTFSASATSGGTFDNLYDQYATEKNIAAAEDRYISLEDPAFWLGVRYLKVRSGTAATPVNQAAARIVNLITKPI